MRPNKYKKGPKSIETGQVVGVFEPPQTEIPANIKPCNPAQSGKTVSEKTAIDLKSAGFPQPENTSSGTWYLKSLDLTIYPWTTVQWEGESVPLSNFSGAVYMPDVVDLLKAMGGQSVALYFDDGKWNCVHPILTDCPKKVFCHDNPVEALALAYIYFKKTSKA
jgi:hypothetical protein